MRKYIQEILGVLLAVCVIIGDIIYILFGDLWQKGLASGFFFLLGVNFFIPFFLQRKRISFPIFMLIGLFCTMIADIVLNLNFIFGAILFAVGHIFYATSYIQLHKLKCLDWICYFILAAPAVLWLTLSPMFNYGGIAMEIVVVIYAIIISLMVGKAISNWIRSIQDKRPFGLEFIITIGSLLFFFSDCMLLLNVFADFPKIVDILCLVSYYPAQILLATSIYCYTAFLKNKAEE